MSKDIKKALEHCVECNCDNCPNGDELGSGKLKLQRKGRYIDAEQCVFRQYKYQNIDDEIDTCPLQSLADYTKQVCEKIRKKFPMPKDDIPDEITYSLNELLDEIEKGGTNDADKNSI